jgi:hypothetical protein
MAALVHIPVGVTVERIKAQNPWIDFVWQPQAILVGVPDALPWTRLSGDEARSTFYAGSAAIELHRGDAGNYRENLIGDCRIWVVLEPVESDPPYSLLKVTADPSEGEAYASAGAYIVDSVPMPDTIHDAVAQFVEEHYVERTFFKRKRDRADPNALARRGPEHRDE